MNWNKYKNTWVGDILSVVGGFIIALILYNLLIFGLGTSMPLVSVFSGSMEHDYFDPQTGYQTSILGVSLDDYWLSHGSWYDKSGITVEEFSEWPISGGFKKGDMLIVAGPSDLELGDVIIFNSGQHNYPIIHRIVEVSDEGYRTKGDHNSQADSWVLEKDQVYGEALIVVPFVGWVKVLFSEITGIV
jgi:signal peptidase I